MHAYTHTHIHTCMLTHPHTRSRTQDVEEVAEEIGKEDTFRLKFAILYDFLLNLEGLGIVRNRQPVDYAVYTGSSYGKNLAPWQLEQKRFARHHRDVANQKHNRKFNSLFGALPVPPRCRPGSVSQLGEHVAYLSRYLLPAAHRFHVYTPHTYPRAQPQTHVRQARRPSRALSRTRPPSRLCSQSLRCSNAKTARPIRSSNAAFLRTGSSPT